MQVQLDALFRRLVDHLDLFGGADGACVDDQLSGVLIVLHVAQNGDGRALLYRIYRRGLADGIEHLDGGRARIIGNIYRKYVFVAGFGDALLDIEHVAPDHDPAAVLGDGADRDHISAQTPAVERTDTRPDELRHGKIALAHLDLGRGVAVLLLPDRLGDLGVGAFSLGNAVERPALLTDLGAAHRLAVLVAAVVSLEHARIQHLDLLIEELADDAAQRFFKALGVEQRLAAVLQSDGERFIFKRHLGVIESAVDARRLTLYHLIKLGKIIGGKIHLAEMRLDYHTRIQCPGKCSLALIEIVVSDELLEVDGEGANAYVASDIHLGHYTAQNIARYLSAFEVRTQNILNSFHYIIIYLLGVRG